MKLVSWNIQWCLGCDGRVDPERIVREARAFADFDVLCLQEVASNFPALQGSRGEDQFAAIAALLPEYAAVPGIAVDTDGPDGTRRRFGNMILSRYPVQQVSRLRLPQPHDPSVRSMPRLLLEAVVEAPFGLLRIMTTHLEYYSAVQRAAQVEALRDWHAQACSHALGAGVRDESQGPFQRPRETISAVLCGDFNQAPTDPLQMRLLEEFGDGAPAFDDAWDVLHPLEARPPTTGVHDREQWPEPFACDFILATRDLRHRLRAVAVDATTAASDHQPLSLEMR